MNKAYLFIVFIIGPFMNAQESPAEKFWSNLQSLCGDSYEGKIKSDNPNDDFAGKKLVMHVRACDEDSIKIPFFVGDDKSRTWILTYEDDKIKLKHDHRHQDGSEDKITQYGGIASNSGLESLQVFPADEETAELIPAAATNVWWITLEDEIFSYNLKRIGSESNFTVEFDLSQSIDSPDAPWGWED